MVVYCINKVRKKKIDEFFSFIIIQSLSPSFFLSLDFSLFFGQSSHLHPNLSSLISPLLGGFGSGWFDLVDGIGWLIQWFVMVVNPIVKNYV